MALCSKCGTPIPIGAGFCPSCGTPVGNSATTGPQLPASGLTMLSRDARAQEYWVRRLVAYVIDSIIVFLVIGLAAAAVAIPSFFASIFIPGYASHLFPFGAFFGPLADLLLVLYFTLAEATYGKTIGKAVMGMRVTTDGGGRPTLGASFLRNLSKIYWVLLLLDVVLGLALEVGYMRKFSDKFLGTSVVQA